MVAIKGGTKLRVLLMSKDLSAAGGVANSVKMQIENFDKSIQAEHFPIGHKEITTRRLYGCYLAVRDSFRLSRKLSQGQYDCIQMNPSLNVRSLLRDGLFLLVILISGFKNIIIFFRGWEAGTEAAIRKSTILRILFLRSISLSPIVLVLGEKFKGSLIEMGVPENKIKVVNNFFDGSIFEGINKERKPNEKRLLFLSRIIREKGIFETLDAFRLLALELPEVRLVLAGDGPDALALLNRAKEWGIRKKVEFTGYVRGVDKGRVLMNSDIFILPTYYGEGCPRALLEAMAAGLPVVTCPVGGIPDIFKDGENGIFLSKVSPITIADAVRRLLTEPDLGARIGENNRRYAWENFEVRSEVKKLEEIYTKVVAQKPGV